jgi:hypothetical protein
VNIRMQPPAPEASAVEEGALDWCDAGSHYVTPGTTKPYEPGSRYRYCDACAREWIPRKAAGAGELALRADDGDR